MSNFVFSRRVMQQSIDHLSGILDIGQITSIVNRLNRPSDKRLPAMWELMLLEALSKSGTLRHETELSDGRRPDIELTIESAVGLPLLVVGDITTISDINLHEQNPVKSLRAELGKAAKKLGLSADHFSYDVRGGRVGKFREGRMSLFLPPKKDLPQFVKDNIAPWLDQLTKAPDKADKYQYTERLTRISLSYHPHVSGSGGGYTSYDVAASRSKNPLFSALKGKKEQLKAAPPEALRLVIVCDGDCSLLRRGSANSSSETFTSREVAEDFLRQNSTIDAVPLITIEEIRQMFVSRVTCRLMCELVVAGENDRSKRLTSESITLLCDALNTALRSMPQPVRSAYSAASLCLQSKYGSDRIGEYSMKGNEITISSRALLRLLSGEISSEDFISQHRWGTPDHPNPFLQNSRTGQLISSIDVNKGGENDDDSLRFSFGFPDPAASPFRVRLPAKED